MTLPLMQLGAAIGAAYLLGTNLKQSCGIFLALWAIIPIINLRSGR